MHVREYRAVEAEALAALYRESVLRLGPQAYAPEQVAAWAIYPEDLDGFRLRLARGLTLVAEVDNQLAGFGQLDPVDRISLLYTSSAFARRGVATAIYWRLEAHAVRHGALLLRTEASRVSRPLFERLGFAVVEIERVVRHGIEFERFSMQKRIAV